MLGVESLRRVFRRGRAHHVVPPDVTVVIPGHVNSGAPHHQNLLDGAFAVRPGCDRFVGVVFQRCRLAAPELPVAGDQHLGLSVGDAGPQRLGGEAPNTTLCMTPSRAHANIAITASGISGR